MTTITLGASTILAVLAITQHGATLAHAEDGTSVPLPPGYMLVTFGPQQLLPLASTTLSREIRTLGGRQDELRRATTEYEDAYHTGVAAIREERRRTTSPGVRQAQQRLLVTLAREYDVALLAARTAHQRITAALAQAKDALHAQHTLRLAQVLDVQQQAFARLIRRANDAAGFLNDQTRRLRRAMIENTRRRTS